MRSAVHLFDELGRARARRARRRSRCSAAGARPARAPAQASAPLAAEQRGLPFWKALAAECAVPAGESAAGSCGEAVSLLGSPDSEWRDDVGYGVVASCVYRRSCSRPESAARSSPAQREPAARRSARPGTDSVLLRSFSALDLSILAALEVQDPALDAPGYRRLARRRARLPARRARPARDRAARRLDPRHRPHGGPAEVPGPRRSLGTRRPARACSTPRGRS